MKVITVEYLNSLSRKDHFEYCIKLMQAVKLDENNCFVNIEVYDYGWEDYNQCDFNFKDYHYRIKPEPEKPEMIPLDFSDAESLIGEKVKNLSSTVCYLITKITRRGIRIEDCDWTYEELKDNFTRLDGSRFEKVKV